MGVAAGKVRAMGVPVAGKLIALSIPPPKGNQPAKWRESDGRGDSHAGHSFSSISSGVASAISICRVSGRRCVSRDDISQEFRVREEECLEFMHLVRNESMLVRRGNPVWTIPGASERAQRRGSRSNRRCARHPVGFLPCEGYGFREPYTICSGMKTSLRYQDDGVPELDGLPQAQGRRAGVGRTPLRLQDHGARTRGGDWSRTRLVWRSTRRGQSHRLSAQAGRGEPQARTWEGRKGEWRSAFRWERTNVGNTSRGTISSRFRVRRQVARVVAKVSASPM